MEKYNIKAPLLSLVPIPAFTMDELSVDFSMEVKNPEAPQDQTDSTAKYKLSPRIPQQSLSEGMDKLSNLFSQMMKPLPKDNLPE